MATGNGMNAVLNTLTPREREIVKLRYGIGDGYIYTIEEVGRIFNITRERVRQIQRKALRKLSHPVRLTRMESIAGLTELYQPLVDAVHKELTRGKPCQPATR